MGPNSATGHSSVLFTSEAQLALTFHLIRPIVEKLRKVQLLKPAPFVEVTTKAEDRFYAEVRKEMKKKVWEKDGGVSWYVDKATGLCSVSCSFVAVAFIRPSLSCANADDTRSRSRRRSIPGRKSTSGARAPSPTTATSSGPAPNVLPHGAATSAGTRRRRRLHTPLLPRSPRSRSLRRCSVSLAPLPSVSVLLGSLYLCITFESVLSRPLS